MTGITSLLWIVWALIGIIGGYMTSKLLGGARYPALYVVAGIAGAVAGGYVFMMWLVPGTSMAIEKLQVLSLCTSLAGAVIVLWLVWLGLGRNTPDDDTDPDA